MKPAQRALAAFAGVAGIALTAGCTAGYAAARPAVTTTPSHVASPAPVPTPQLSSVLSKMFPIASYQLTPLQNGQADYLAQRLQQLCMRGFGFSYNSGLTTGVIAQEVRINAEFETRLYGVSDPAAARQDGYNLPAWTRGSQAPITASSLPHGELAVLTGTVPSYQHQQVPAGGCLGQAGRVLSSAGVSEQTRQSGGSDPSDLAARIQLDSFEHAQSDPRVKAVFATWSACLRPFGRYSTPFKPAADPRWASRAHATPQEIKTAQHDIACKIRTNVIGVEYAVISDYQNQAIAQNAGTLAKVQAGLRTQVAGLRRLMARYGVPQN